MMAQIVFLDTDVILDYLESRNQEIRDIIAQLLLLHKKGRIVLATSAFNIAELIDKEFEIHFIGWCLNEKMSYDETVSKLNRDEKLFIEVSCNNRKEIEKRIDDFIFKKEIRILSFDVADQYRQLYGLIYQQNIRSQDALVVATASLNKATYFLSNDSNLIAKIGNMFDTYNLRNKDSREAFKNSVLEAI
jgi:predicted nucleic acid-binding protein